MAEQERATLAPVRKHWVALPCVQSLHEGSATLRSTERLSLLAPTLPSTLKFRVRADHPDVIVIAGDNTLLAVMGPPGTGMFRDTPTILLSTALTSAVIRQAARMHINSVLPLKPTHRQLETAIAATIEGLAVTLPRFAETADATSQVEHLTVRELDVLRLMARGHRNKQMAAQLDISEHTVKFHVSSVLAKLGARTRTAAVTIGVTRGLVAI